jgi:branched-chain amino acid transport system substrate-binding protein
MNNRSHPPIWRALLLLLLATQLIAPLAHAEPNPLKIGFIGGFSGPGSSYGEASKNGLEMALGELGREGIEVIYEDDQFIPAKTVTAFKRLTEVEKVDLIIVLASSPSKVVAPLAEQKQLPVLAWASDTGVSGGREHIFRSWTSGDEEGRLLAQEVAKRGYPSTAFLAVTNDYGRSVQAGFNTHSEAKPILSEECAGDETDFRSFLLKLKARNIQHLGICLTPGQSAALAKQARSMGMKLGIFGCETLEDRGEVELSQGALIGSWFVTAAVTERFHEVYLKRFGNDTVLSGAAVHYDLGRILKGIAGKKARGREIVELLRNAQVTDGALGSYTMKRNARDQYLDIQLVLKEVTPSGFKCLP